MYEKLHIKKVSFSVVIFTYHLIYQAFSKQNKKQFDERSLSYNSIQTLYDLKTNPSWSANTSHKNRLQCMQWHYVLLYLTVFGLPSTLYSNTSGFKIPVLSH